MAPLLSRRQFVTSSLAALALPARGKGDEPVVGGDRIDCQSHLFCPELVAMMERRRDDPRVYTEGGQRYLRMGAWLRKLPPQGMDVDAKLAAMDAAGVRQAALSINDPGPEWFGPDAAAAAVIANDFVADVVRRHPTRFFGLAVLPLPDVPAALRELDRCMSRLHLKGILLYTNYAGRFPDEPAFRAVFARAVELDVPVLLHPAKPVMLEQVAAYEMTASLGNMFEDTIALTRLIMSGLLDEFPGLKLVCPHLGGALPFLIGRLDHQTQVLKRGPRLARKPSDYVKSIWLDIVSPLPLAIQYGHSFMGPDRLLFSSDHPWVDPSLMVSCLQQARLPAADEAKIFSGNARSVFGL